MIEKVIKRASSRIKTPNQLAFSGFQRVSENRLTLIMDCGEPPKEKTYGKTEEVIGMYLLMAFTLIDLTTGNQMMWSLILVASL